MANGVNLRLLSIGRALEGATLAWNVGGVVVLALTALKAHSVALGGFGLDSAVEIAASVVVLAELGGTDARRQARVVTLIGWAFIILAAYLAAQSTVLLVLGVHPHHSTFGMAWTAATALAMFGLASGKHRVGVAMGSQLLQTESRVTFVDGLLATFVLVGLGCNALLGWWWADPAAAYLIVLYSVRESIEALRLGRTGFAVVDDGELGGCGQSCSACTNLCERPAADAT
jgi:divalent metal cation (Fe/Co/Zn/Cd) transporter